MLLVLNGLVLGPQMPVQPVTAAGPEHSKSLEKPELYSSLFQSGDQTKVLPSTPAPSAQIYSPDFSAGRPNDVYRYRALSVSTLFSRTEPASQQLTPVTRDSRSTVLPRSDSIRFNCCLG